MEFVLLDIDECTDNSHLCNANERCHNTMGSYTCHCATGWSGNVGSCSGKGVTISRKMTVGNPRLTCYGVVKGFMTFAYIQCDSLNYAHMNMLQLNLGRIASW